MQSLLKVCGVFFVICFVAVSSASAAAVGKATYFRSDGGVAADEQSLPDGFDSPSAQVWKVAIDGGHSTPILNTGRIFLTTWTAAEKQLATVALDQKTGRILWRNAITPKQVEQTHEIGSPATATAACDGERVFVFFGSAGLFCYNLDGKQLWEQRIGPFRDEYGAGSSPIVFDGKVILNEDHDIDSFLASYDATSGKMLWRVARSDAVRSYSTPVVWRGQGKPEILVAGALQLIAYDPDSGKRLWWANGLARIAIPTPVTDGQIVYMASWAPGGDAGRRISFDPWPAALAKWDSNHDGKLSKNEVDNRDVLERFYRMDLDQDGFLNQQEWEKQAAVFTQARNSIFAIKPAGNGELPSSSVLWKHDRGVPYVSTPVLYRSSIWMVKDGGIVTRLDASSGRMLHEERVPAVGNYFSSPVAGDGKVYFASEPGTVSVVSAEDDWKVISSHDFHEKIFATPVIAEGRIYLRTEQNLYCFKKPND